MDTSLVELCKSSCEIHMLDIFIRRDGMVSDEIGKCIHYFTCYLLEIFKVTVRRYLIDS